MTPLIAARPIDFAIFGTLGSLWLGGSVFIYVLFRWIFRFEREQREGMAGAESARPPAEAS